MMIMKMSVFGCYLWLPICETAKEIRDTIGEKFKEPDEAEIEISQPILLYSI